MMLQIYGESRISNDEFIVSLKRIKLLVLDVDGTLTDGGMYYSKEGDSIKKFHAHDGMGINLLQRSGINIALITSETSDIVIERSKKLHIQSVVLGSKNKVESLTTLLDNLSLTCESVAYMGDDVNDAQAMKLCGLSIVPNNAVEYMKNIAQYVCMRSGGNGAVREVAELILSAQSLPNFLPEQW